MTKFLLLIGFLAATALAAPPPSNGDRRHKGVCPALPPDMMGICVELCSSDADCDRDSKCCSNGCGHTCQLAQPPTTGCATIRCARCHKCVGHGKCVPKGGPGCATQKCERHNPCRRDTYCEDTENGPTCKMCLLPPLAPPPEGCYYNTVYPHGDTGCPIYKLVCGQIGQTLPIAKPPPGGASCAATLCEKCSDCVEVDGQAKCVRQGNCCPDDEQHQCLVDPCKAISCPAATHCKSDFCGGCNAIFYDDKWDQLSEAQCGDEPEQ